MEANLLDGLGDLGYFGDYYEKATWENSWLVISSLDARAAFFFA
jgi:hypothetical protein